MKFTTLLAIAAATSVSASPIDPSSTNNNSDTVYKRADYCGQWDSSKTGPYTIYNNLWGRADATSGSQCTGVDGMNGNTLKWHTGWSWAGGPRNVKSYANAVLSLPQKKPLSAIQSLNTAWYWSYTGTNIVANVAYDLFTSSTASGSTENEIMIWLAALGGAGPISATGKPIASITLAGTNWKLYKGRNGQMNVFSFVASSAQQNFRGDLMEFFNYLVQKQGLPASQILTSAGAGTEPFSGSGAKMVTKAYSLSQR